MENNINDIIAELDKDASERYGHFQSGEISCRSRYIGIKCFDDNVRSSSLSDTESSFICQFRYIDGLAA